MQRYQPSDFLVTHTDLLIDLTKKPIVTRAKLTVTPNILAETKDGVLRLHGQNISLRSVKVNDVLLTESQYQINADGLQIYSVPDVESFTVECEAELGVNTDYFGIYETDGIILAKAESEGMRRVLFCIDRPDVLSTYTTTLLADKAQYPVLLSNGKKIDSKEYDNNIHSVTWHDATPKPTYLFAMVGGHLDKVTNEFKTKSGRIMPIEFYVPTSAVAKCTFGQEILKKALQFDEDTYDLECERDAYMVACVDKYASGASETTGLNLFNSQNLYVTPASSRDKDFLRVAEVVSHEFFHDKSGNTVTIRDWSNLTLKEGMTTFRAAMFCEEVFGAGLMRILAGKTLIADAPRPAEYATVRSLYTQAAYEKGAEIFRMIMEFIGREKFNTAIHAYFQHFKGGAITLEAFFSFISDVTEKDVRPFMTWFTEAGAVDLHVKEAFDQAAGVYTLTFRQSCDQNDVVRPIPIKLALYYPDGTCAAQETTFLLEQSEDSLSFMGLKEKPVPSLLRGFSAPVNLQHEESLANLYVRMQHDTDPFNRHDATHRVASEFVKDYSAAATFRLNDIVAAYRVLFNDQATDPFILAEMLTIPSVEELCKLIGMDKADRVADGRRYLQKALATHLQDDIQSCIERLMSVPAAAQSPFQQFDCQAAGRRALLFVCRDFLSTVAPDLSEEQALRQFNQALGKHMDDTMKALQILVNLDSVHKQACFKRFYDTWQHDNNVLNLWFTIQASEHSKDVVQNVAALLKHPAFEDFQSPNKVYALLGAFTRNNDGLHAKSGAGYQLIAEAILKLDKLNPPVAARIANCFASWDKLDAERRIMVYKQLRYLAENAQSANVQDIIKKALAKKSGEDVPSIAGGTNHFLASKPGNHLPGTVTSYTKGM